MCSKTRCDVLIVGFHSVSIVTKQVSAVLKTVVFTKDGNFES